jgi:hypothetical protein
MTTETTTAAQQIKDSIHERLDAINSRKAPFDINDPLANRLSTTDEAAEATLLNLLDGVNLVIQAEHDATLGLLVTNALSDPTL